MSKLDVYIKKLMQDDDALKYFLADPIRAAEDEHGLTKAQRAVLRRVVTHLSNNSTNGYSVVRNLGSYRRSLRLLQNVMHVERGNALAAMSGGDSADTNYAVTIYYTGNPNSPVLPLDQVGGEYAYSMTFTASNVAGSNPTIKDVMRSAVDSYGNCLADLINGGDFDSAQVVNSIDVPSNYPGTGTYTAPPGSIESHQPFWFYSLGDKALVAGSGTGGYTKNPNAGVTFQVSFAEEPVSPGVSTIFWQVIAPDEGYHFQSCIKTTKANLLE